MFLEAQKSLFLEGCRQNSLFVFSVVGYSTEGLERWSQEVMCQERAARGCSIRAGRARSTVVIYGFVRITAALGVPWY